MATEDTKPQKVAAPKKRATFSHPTYQEMINDAILALKERNGSSQYAIARFIEEKQKELPPTFRKKLLFSLKSLVKSGKLVKVKGSFKLPPSSSAKPEKKPAALAKAKPKPKAKAAASPAKPKMAAAAVVKPKAAPARPKPKERPAKAARTSARTSPGKKPAVAPKKSTAKTAKSKSVKTPTKKVLPRKAKK